jgi:hypothetical protein
MAETSVRKLIETHPFVGDLHDSILDDTRRTDGSIDLSAAYDEAICWLSEYIAQVRTLEKACSSGILRRDTSHIKWKPKQVPEPVDDGEWIATGREDD